jgi:hypothetical protein
MPGFMPDELDTVIVFEPWVRPPVILTDPDMVGVGPEPKLIAPVPDPLQFKVVDLEEELVPPTEAGPAPRRVTFDGMVRLLFMRKVPELSNTTWPAGQESSAD